MKSIKLSRKNSIIIMAVSIAVAVILIVANIVTGIYSGLITVALSSGGTVSSEEGKKTCQEVEAEGIVLLKNRDGALPLSSDEKNLALIGQDSVDFVYGGAGSGSVDTANAPTLKTALEKSDFRVNTTLWNFYETGAGKAYRKQVPDSSGKGSFAVNEVPQSVYTDAVLSSMDNDDVGVVVIGRSGGESADIPTTPLASGYLYLEPDKDELDMIAMACGKFDKVIVIINSNNAMELGFLEDPAYANVKAALWVGAVGQEGMYAIGEVLSGKVNPSGRLVDTYAYDSLSAPSAQNMGSYSITNASEVTDYANNAKNYLVYREGIYVGYKYYETRYEDAVLGQGNAGDYDYEEVVQYPFGYGLSYTEFDWSDMTVEETEDAFDISLTVTNNGGYAGKDVVEIYMQSPYTPGGIEKSAVELVGFAKTDVIETDGSQTVTVSVAKESMKAYDADTAKTYVVDAGTYYFAAGRNAHDALNNILVAKNADVDIVIIAACGERAGEVVEILKEFPELTDPRTGKSLMERTIIICNTSSMPVAAREASVYTSITLAEYYRQMGLSVLMLADSTSRWAQAMREMSGRLEEIPGDEAFPAYLESVIASFYERAGKVMLRSGEVASVTIGGTVSPAGGNFEEPVTQATLKMVGAFHGLSRERSDARKYPAIHPTESWSKYRGVVEQDKVDYARGLLIRSAEINQMMKVVGEEGVSAEDYITYQKGELLDAAYLQQDSFDPIDAACGPERQKRVFAVMYDILTSSFSAEDKKEIRGFFNQLRQLILDWHTIEFETEHFNRQEERIRDFYKSKTSQAV